MNASPAPVHPGRRDRRTSTLSELAAFLPDLGRLLWSLARDPRVSWKAKAVAGSAMVYVMSPLDVLPDVVPAGWADDAWVAVQALRYLVSDAGYDLVREHWTGSSDGFALLLGLAGIAE